MDLGNVIVV